jgi:hypothetical protein
MKIKRFFQDSQGKIVIAQWPNTSLWLVIGFFAIGLFPQPLLQSISFWGVLLSLVYWSYLEISSGVNGWRKLLGIVVLILQGMKLYKLFFQP